MAKSNFPDATYLLLIDADMVLEIKWNIFKKNVKHLKADSYLVKQCSANLEYWNIRLIKASLDWKCIGVTHEYWEATDAKPSVKLESIEINDIGDGGSKQDKFSRDERLLINGINDPEVSISLRGRYHFYLAQTYKDMGKYIKSIFWYQRRIEKPSIVWKEELFYSLLQIGNCYQQLGDFSRAVTAYLSAWETRPVRAESLYQLASMYRQKTIDDSVGHNLVSYHFCQLGINIPFPVNDHLFVDPKVYQYKFDIELSIVCFYFNDKKKQGKEAIQRLQNNWNLLDDNEQQMVISNAKHYDITI